MKTVITYGVFDLFHEGHIRLLERAHQLGDHLIVGVTTDRYALERGKLCVVDSLEVRMENVRRCACVDEVIVEDHFGQKAEDIIRLGIDILAMGDDWLGKFDALKDICEVVYLPRTPNISSSLLRNSRFPFLCIGLIGTGRIAGRFVQEAGYVRGIQIPCVYNPHADTSASLQNFLSRNTFISKTRTLEKLFDQTDAVYIASPHDTHYAYAKAALEAGKHVLCEKPLCLRRAEAEELFELAESNGLVLMEGIKTAYCPGFLHLCGVARSGFIGEIINVESCFTKLVPSGNREWMDLSCGGSFTELGSYILLPIVKLLGTEDVRISFDSVLGDNGLDLFTRVNVMGRNRIGSGRCGIGAKGEGQLVIFGTKGYILCEAPWWKTKYFEIRGEDPNFKKCFSDEFIGDGLRYEIADFFLRIQGYSGRESRLLPAESIWMAGVMEKFLKIR